EVPVDEIVIWNRTDGGVGTRLNNFTVSALDGERKSVFETKVVESPSPSREIGLGGVRMVALANATADLSVENSEAAKAIDADGKTGWSATGAGKARTAVFEVSGKIGEDADALLVFTLDQKAGKKNTIGRFRLSATTHDKPVRALPENINAIIAIASDKRTEAQKNELTVYYRELAPSLAKPRQQLAKLKKELADLKPIPLPVMREVATDKLRETHILVKGNFLSPSDKVEAGLPKAFDTR